MSNSFHSLVFNKGNREEEVLWMSLCLQCLLRSSGPESGRWVSFPTDCLVKQSQIHTWWQCLAENLERTQKQHPGYKCRSGLMFVRMKDPV